VAFIREDMQQGDPFRFRRPKLKRFKGLGKFRGLVRFVPGVGPVLDSAMNVMGDPDDDDFSRGYGFDQGDPGKGKPSKRSRSVKSRKPEGRGKGKGRGPKTRDTRSFSEQHPNMTKLGGALAGGIPFLGGMAQTGLEMLAQQHGPDVAEAVASGALDPAALGGMSLGAPGGFGMTKRGGRGTRMPHMAHRHVDAWTVKGTRTMNVANVRALKHGIRRLDGFQKLVSRVEKAFPRLKAGRHASSHARKGHKAGCKCVGCR